MRLLTAFSSLLSLALLSSTNAVEVIGPNGSLTVSNKVIAPDGYRRAAVVVEDQFPGPLIRGYKVSKRACGQIGQSI